MMKKGGKNICFFNKGIFYIFLILWMLSIGGSGSVITPITHDGLIVSHENPSLDSHYIIWSDNRDGNYATYLYDLTTGIETRVSPSVSFTPQFPKISGDLIVYQDDSDVATHIFLYSISSNQTIRVTNDPNEQSEPAVSGNRIVWQDRRSGNYHIFVNGTVSGSETDLFLTGANQQYPDISHDLVVWQDDRNGNWDIYLYNLTSQMETGITNEGSGQTHPAIYGNRIVWMDSRNGNDEIFTNGTTPGTEYSLTPDDPLVIHAYPSISGSKVIWQNGISEIFMNDTSVAAGSLTQIETLPGGSPYRPKIFIDPLYGDRVVWQETSSGNEIYLYTSGASGPCPVADFSHDFNGGAAPITVQFRDQSTAGATHWFWNFGDGSNSSLQNPAHTYLNNISHDVSLTVGNPYCRNITIKTNNVVIGKPVTDFSASLTSDIVPATISFTDQSSGSPTSWLWDFGDGASSTVQNDTHTYSAIGTYSVSLTATNAFGSSQKTRTNYITVLKGANEIANTTIDGLTTIDSLDSQSLSVDISVLPAALMPNNSVLEIKPPSDRGFRNITVYAFDGFGFSRLGSVISGNVTGVHLESRVISPSGFSMNVGSPLFVNYSADVPSYPTNARLTTKIWENAIAEDNTTFEKIALGSHFSHYLGSAYTTKIIKQNISSVIPLKFYMSVNSSWVSSTPDGRNQTFIERISDDGVTGEVLDTWYISTDPINNLDYFVADSPHGMSTFGLSQLSGSGNPLQLVTLTIASHVISPSGGAPSSYTGTATDSESSPATGTSRGATAQTAANAKPGDQKAPSIADMSVTGNVYTNPNGVVSQASAVKSVDSRAMFGLNMGIIAKGADGKPLSSISMAPADPDIIQAGNPGAEFTYSGIAYELGPDGATFSPAAELTVSAPPNLGSREYTIRTLDQKSGTWQDLPTSHDPATGKITAMVSHLCCFALFEKPLTASSSAGLSVPVVTETPTTAVVSAPPSTAITIFLAMMVYVFDLMRQNLLVLVVLICLIILLYALGRKRRMDRIRYLL
jgi:beta propeller repeat protein